MRFVLLDEVGAVRNGQSLDLGPPKQRLVLAALLADGRRVVPAARLIDRVWGATPPPGVSSTLYSYLARLRSALGDGAVLSRAGGGYRLSVPAGAVDLWRWERLLRQARDADGPVRAQLFDQALKLWSGRPLGDLEGGWVDELRAHLERQRLDALAEWAQLRLAAGDAAEVARTLAQAVQEQPLAEGLVAGYLQALHQAGRTAEALECYARTRDRTIEDLGVEPGALLRGIYLDLLRSDEMAEPGRPQHVPRQLPAPPQMFTGRAGELADLDKIHDASTVVISAIDGMAGVGKTALAVQAAHRMVDRYPDGQLFIDLHGYTQGMAPVEPGEALDRMLRSLGIPGERMPADLDERAGLYRSRLADRRMVIVLDNAATETQVTPLLPGAPGCAVLITSRRRLAGLDHTHTLSLDTLPPFDAVTLFRQTAGKGLLARQSPELVAELVELCGRLPLAIRIAAARLRSHPAWDLAHLVQRLRDHQHRLVELAAGQRSVIAALDLSYQHLSTGQQRLYRLLGLHPGADIEPYAAAALLDSTLLEAGRVLEQLLEAHLLQEPVPGRYRFHDLTRVHAADTAARHETEAGRRMALNRLLDHYLHATAVAMDAAYPYERERRPRVSPARTPTPALSVPAPALGWLDSELPNLLAAARYATEHDRPEHTLHLSSILRRHLHTRGRLNDAVSLHQQALTIARGTGQQAAELEALTRLGDIRRLQGRHREATSHYQRALRLARATGHRPGELYTLVGLGWVRWLLGRYELAADHYGRALRLAHATGDRLGELDALVGLGHVRLRQARYELAADHYGRALRLARATGDRVGELDALVGLGHVHLRQGRYGQATEQYQQALQRARATGHRPGELYALVGLGHVHLRQGRYGQATEQYQQVQQRARATGHRPGELYALVGLGHIHLRQGRYAQATDHYQRLLDLAQQSGERNYQFEAWQGLGRLQLVTGHPDAALPHLARALALADELGQPDGQARAHDGLAHTHHALHHLEQAHTHWQHALDILTRFGIDHTDDEAATAVAIRTHLGSLSDHHPSSPKE